MRLAPLVRRSVAVLAATALVSGGGLITGLTVGTAGAVEVFSTTPKFPINIGTTAFTIQGRQFQSDQITSIDLVKVVTADGQGVIAAATYENNSGRCLPSAAGITCGDTLGFTADLTNAAPGDYNVVVTTGFGPASEEDICNSCVTILAGGPPTLSSVARYNSADGQLVFAGTNLAKGTRLQFLQTDGAGAPTVVEPFMSFTPQTVSGSTTTSGYVSPTVFRGTYAAQPGVAPGLHKIRVVNTEGSVSNTIDFFQPQLVGITPAVLGQGATAVPTTVIGNGFHPSSTFGISSVSTTTPDITVLGPADVTSTTVAARVSVTATSAAAARTVTVRGADGGFASSGSIFSTSVGPKFATSNPVTPTTRGQGSDSTVTVSGTGFNAGTTFSFGEGVTATTLSVTGGTSAAVQVVVDALAPLTTRSVTVTNTDFGMATLANGFTVSVSPKITSSNPPSASPGTGPFNVLLDGSDFTSAQTFSVAVVPADNIAVGTVNRVNDKQLQTTFTVGAGALAGPRNLVVTNNNTGGKSTCVSCFGINSLSISPPASTNTVVRSLTLTSNAAGSPFTAGTTVRLFLPGPPAYQGPIAGTNVAFDPITGKITTDVDLQNVATGLYNVETTTGTTVLFCSGCLTVTAPVNPTVTSVTPATGGAGATGRLVTLAGTGFSPGETVTFSGTGVTATDVTYVSPTELTAVVSIDPAAPVGPRNVTVTNIGDGKAGSLTNGFTVTAAPVTTEIAPAQIGQGATTDVTLTGTGYAADAVASFGEGTTNVLKDAAGAPTTLVYTVTVSPTADTTAPRSVRVVNGDGGAGTLANALVLTQAPRLTAIVPDSAKAGDTLTDVTFTGTNFRSETEGEGETAVTTFPQVTIAGVTVTEKSVSEDGTSLIADLVVAANAASGTRVARIVNPDLGESTLANAFTIVIPPPTAPTQVSASAGDARATVSFSGANGQGNAISAYTVRATDTTGTSAPIDTEVSAPQQFAVVTGLTNGKAYSFTVRAKNDAGYGEFSTVSATATPKFSTALTSTRNVSVGTAGSRVTYSGTLTRVSNGAPVGGASVVVTLTPDIGASRVVTVSTSSTGTWSFAFAPTYNTTVKARYNGDSDHSAVNASTYRMGVQARVTRTAPVTGTTTPASSTVFVKGSLSPNKTGRTITVMRGSTVVGKAVVAGNGTFSIPVKLPRGTHTVRISIGATPGNVASNSTNFVLRRS